MSIDYDITSNFEAIEEWMDFTADDIIVKAGKTAINKTLVTLRKETIKIMSKQYRLKPTGLSKKKVKDNTRIIKAKGKFLPQLEGVLLFKSEPISMLNFVRGNKNLIKLKGVKVKRRRKLKVEVKPGKTQRIVGGFIQKKHSKQVFRGGSRGFIKLGLPSQTDVMMRSRNTKRLLKRTAEVFGKEFSNQVQFRLDKASQKLTNKSLKKT